MGKDALGHGHDPGTPGNPSHDARGRFSDGGGGSNAKGDAARGSKAGMKAVSHALLSHGHLSKAAAKAAANAGKQKWGKPHVTEVKGSKGPRQGRGSNPHPIMMHGGRVSLGTHEARGGGGGGDGGGGGLTAAARDSVIRKKGIDLRHGLLPGVRGPENLSQARDIGRRRPPGTRE